ncbi:Vacuolar protein sorting-associated protein 62 [Cryptotrichosporon argae]
MHRIAIVALLLAGHVLGRPTAPQHVFEPPPHTPEGDRHGKPDPERAARMAKLLDQYAPVVKLSAFEVYFPSSIEYMFDHYSFIEHDNGTSYETNSSILTPADLYLVPELGLHQSLSIRERHNPQPFLADEAGYLMGPAGQEGGMKCGADGRGVIEENVYAFWVDQGRGVVDLWYWTFYPFNFGKLVGSFGILGNHVTDWEHLRVRTINGTAVSADFDTHSGPQYSAGTVRWEDIEKHEGRPVGYAAAGSHGMWPTPGDHIYAHLLDLFRLVDVTDDDGAVWDTAGRVVPLQYWDNPADRRRMWHGGEDGWVNFRGHWGNRGKNDCWWHRIVGICQLVDGPPGPNRQFGGPPDCTIAPLAWETSTFAFYLGAPVVRYAQEQGVTVVQVEQVCGKARKGDGDDGGDDGDDGDGGDGEDGGGDGGDDDGDDDDDDLSHLPNGDPHAPPPQTAASTVRGSTPFLGAAQHVVTTLPCAGRRVVDAYRVSLCLPSGRCVRTFAPRRLCTYETGRKGYAAGRAVSVDDPDDWRFD